MLRSAVSSPSRFLSFGLIVLTSFAAACAGADQALEKPSPPPQPVSRPAPPPVVLPTPEPAPPRLAAGRAELVTDGFTVEYPEGAADDARRTSEWTFGAIAALTEFTGLAWRDVVGDGVVRVRLAGADENRKRPGETEVRSKFTGLALAAEIELLTPSAHRETRTDAVGVPFGESYFRRVLARQTGVLYAQRLRRLRPGGYSFDTAPRWFQQGVAEWLGVELAADDPAGLWSLYRTAAGEVAATPTGLRVANDAIDGALVVRFLADSFGRERLRALLLAPENDFYEALTATCGVTAEELGSRYRP